MYIYKHVRVYVRVCVFVCVCVYVCIYVCMYVCMYVFMYVHVQRMYNKFQYFILFYFAPCKHAAGAYASPLLNIIYLQLTANIISITAYVL